MIINKFKFSNELGKFWLMVIIKRFKSWWFTIKRFFQFKTRNNWNDDLHGNDIKLEFKVDYNLLWDLI